MKKKLLVFAWLLLGLLAISCGNAVDYNRLDAPEAYFSIDYPSVWEQDSGGVFHGEIEGEKITLYIISTTPSEFNIEEASLEYERRFIDGAEYYVGTPQVVNNKSTRFYVRYLSAEVIIVLISEVGEGTSQTVKNELGSHCIHMVESLALSGE